MILSQLAKSNGNRYEVVGEANAISFNKVAQTRRFQRARLRGKHLVTSVAIQIAFTLRSRRTGRLARSLIV